MSFLVKTPIPYLIFIINSSYSLFLFSLLKLCLRLALKWTIQTGTVIVHWHFSLQILLTIFLSWIILRSSVCLQPALPNIVSPTEIKYQKHWNALLRHTNSKLNTLHYIIDTRITKTEFKMMTFCNNLLLLTLIAPFDLLWKTINKIIFETNLFSYGTLKQYVDISNLMLRWLRSRNESVKYKLITHNLLMIYYTYTSCNTVSLTSRLIIKYKRKKKKTRRNALSH